MGRPFAAALVALLAIALAGPGSASAVPAPPGCTFQSQTFTGAGGTVNDAVPGISGNPDIAMSSSFPVSVSGLGASIQDVAVTTNLPSSSGYDDLRLELLAPGGTPDVLVRAARLDQFGYPVNSTDPTEPANVFNGTVWQEAGADPAVKTTFTPNVTATPLEPDASLAFLHGRNPNGTWTLKITDVHSNGANRTLSSWRLRIDTCASAPAGKWTSFTDGIAKSVPHPGGLTAKLKVSAPGCYLDVATLHTDLVNNSAPKLRVTLTDPAGHAAKVTDGNGPPGTADAFDGTLWDDLEATRVTSANYSHPPLGYLLPQQGFAAFTGDDPNGTWTLNVVDGSGDSATLQSWALSVHTIGACPSGTPGGGGSGGGGGTGGSGGGTNGGGTGGGANGGGTSGGSRRHPVLSRLRVSPARFRSAKRRRAGTTIAYVDSRTATTTLTIARVFRCRRGRRCPPPARRGRLTHRDRAGANRVRFSGRLRGHRLAPGRYVVTAVARDAAGASRPVSGAFVITA